MNKRTVSLLSAFAGTIIGAAAGAGAVAKKSGKAEMKMKEYSDKHLALFLLMNQWVRVKQEGKSLSDYFEKNGYTTEDYDPSKIKEYKEKDAIFVYGVKYGPLSIIQHFGRANALNGIDIGDNATASKWGSYAIYETKDVNCYKGSSGYGECSFVCYKK